jgi:hypothetical protein
MEYLPWLRKKSNSKKFRILTMVIISVGAGSPKAADGFMSLQLHTAHMQIRLNGNPTIICPYPLAYGPGQASGRLSVCVVQLCTQKVA